jgi:sporulation protein YlmC with PRC-barrel domain
MIDLPMNAEVHCSDGFAGLSTYVIGNPVYHQVTHLVVKSFRPPFPENLVPVDEIEETTPNRIQLKCSRAHLMNMEAFVYEEYLRTQYTTYLSLPYMLPAHPIPEEHVAYVPIKHHNIPRGEIAVWRGAKVEATDGYVGLVDELLINSRNMQVTHLILDERHIFTQREITIPVSQIARVDEDTIYLKLDKKSIEELPTTPFERWLLQGV